MQGLVSMLLLAWVDMAADMSVQSIGEDTVHVSRL